ncbi:MAG: hypothetical protein U9R08_03445 [Nanoarchaeota archaeon]|nr:hypothetical protein [Nanoarchaeota archaeon]
MIYYKLFVIQAALLMFFYAIVVGVEYVWLNYAHENDKRDDLNEQSDRESFDRSWQEVNKILGRMPGGSMLQWRRGIGAHSKVTAFRIGNEIKRYRSIIGIMTETNQKVIIIYNMTDKDIDMIKAAPDMDTLIDPFKTFNPFRSGQQANMVEQGKKKRGGFLKVVDEEDNEEENNKIQPSEDVINSSMGYVRR